MSTFLDSISDYRSVAFVGLAKNAGKTECLNHVLRMLASKGTRTAVTSIGVDGESTDAVSATRKPEITLFEGTVFVTSESFYRTKRLTAEILSTGDGRTSLGRLVTARVVIPGKVILAGPPDTATLRDLIRQSQRLDIETMLVDGALSRLSLGAPEVTDAMVLATGAAIAPSIPEITARTAFACEIMTLPQTDPATAGALADTKRGVWAIDSEGNIHDLDIPTALAITTHKEKLFSHGTTIYVAGAVTDKLLDFLRSQPQAGETTLIMRDFSCMFASPMSYRAFRAKGGRMMVLKGCRLLGICVNPTSPQGYRVDSRTLCEAITSKTGFEAIDVMNPCHSNATRQI